MTLSTLSFVVFVDPYQGINGICLLSSLKICGIFGIRHSSIVPSISHPITNWLMWSS
jgi:phage regulator Rha-like protein